MHQGPDSQSGCRQDRRHTLQYDLAWRTLQDDTARASPSVRSQLGDSLKSALSYTFRTGAFDDPTFPLSGYGLRCAQCQYVCIVLYRFVLFCVCGFFVV